LENRNFCLQTAFVRAAPGSPIKDKPFLARGFKMLPDACEFSLGVADNEDTSNRHNFIEASSSQAQAFAQTPPCLPVTACSFEKTSQHFIALLINLSLEMETSIMLFPPFRYP
jgi:hypothetical protein